MLSLVAALMLAPPELGPNDLGRALYYTGVCRQLGYVVDAEDSDRAGRAFVAAYPGGASAAFETQLRAGIDDALEEFVGLATTLSSERDLPTFQAAIRTRCEGVIRDFPGMMTRTSSTEADFTAATAQLLEPEPPAASAP